MYFKRSINTKNKNLLTLFLVGFFLFYMPSKVLGVELIVNANNPVETLSLDTVRFIFLMRNKTWEDGENVNIYVNDWSSSLHNTFCKEVLKVIPHRINSSWERKKYSGMGSIPKTVSEKEMLQRVAEDPYAIGYVSEVPQQFKDKIKILKIE